MPTYILPTAQAVPTGYATATWSQPGGIYTVGGSASCTLSASGANAYTIRDLTGATVASGAVSGTSITIPTTVTDVPGWYRLYLTGAANDANYGTSRGASNFIVVRAASYLPAVAGSPPSIGVHGQRVRDAMGVGPSRYGIDNPTQYDVNITFGGQDLLVAQAVTTYLGASYLDSDRPRKLFMQVINAPYFGFTITSGGTASLFVLPKPGTDASRTFIRLAAGTSSGFKLTVYAPDDLTVAETYDNQASADALVTSVNAGSAYLQLTRLGGPSTGLLLTAQPFPTPIVGGAIDYLPLFNSSTAEVVRLYPKTPAVDGQNVTVTTAAGTASGIKITLAGAGGTETYDNLGSAAAAVTAMAASAYATPINKGGAWPVATGSTGRLANGIAGAVGRMVAAFPDVTYWEGPYNEPQDNTGANAAEIAQQMRLFQGAVHAGRSGALAMGPGPVSFNAGTQGLPWIKAFLAAGGHSYCDAFSVHAYNATEFGDLATARRALDGLKAALAAVNYTGPLWQTEQGSYNTTGVARPRRAARTTMQHLLLLEQYGIPKEQNHYWYTESHGFWSFPHFLVNGDFSANAQAAAIRVYAEEVHGKHYTRRLDFGTPGNDIYIGNVYTSTADGSQLVALQATCALPNGSATLGLPGQASVTTISATGSSSTLPVAGGRVAVPVSDLPVYVRVPAGVTVSLLAHTDWPDLALGATPNLAGRTTNPLAQPLVSGSLTHVDTLVSDFPVSDYYYNVSSGIVWRDGTATFPATAGATVPAGSRVDRVVIFAGVAYQADSTLTDFDVQTRSGGTWTTQTTVTAPPAPTAFSFVTASEGWGSQAEGYWQEQTVFLVTLPAPVVCDAVRVNVRATTYGGAESAATMAPTVAAINGEGATPSLVVRSVQAYAANLNNPRYAVR